jgi:hypothetical protein
VHKQASPCASLAAQQLYWNSATTGAQGNITGHGANSGKPRGAAGQIRSVVMFLGSSHTPSPKRMLLMTNSSGGIVENLDAWRNSAGLRSTVVLMPALMPHEQFEFVQ